MAVNDIRKKVVDEATDAIAFCLESMMVDTDTLTLKMIVKDLGVEVSSDLDPDNTGESE